MVKRSSTLEIVAATLFVLPAVLIGACSPDLQYFGQDGAGGGGGDTSSSSASNASSNNASSSSTTNASSSSSGMGPSCGDTVCQAGETFENCPQDCPPSPPCEHDVCETGDALMLGCDPCVDTVCAEDGFCCSDSWDGQCIGAAENLCAAGCCGNGICAGEDCDSCPADCGMCVCGDSDCNGGETCTDCAADCGACAACPHDVCSVGAALSTVGCKDPCSAAVCAQDPGCCGGPNWNGACQNLAAQLCTTGDPCVVAVCAQNSNCCDPNGAGWDATCVTAAESLCSTGCDCPHDVCDTGMPLSPGCHPCAADLCAVDAYCCNQGWDGICVGEVATICGVICP
jgi:hypothetical protein